MNAWDVPEGQILLTETHVPEPLTHVPTHVPEARTSIDVIDARGDRGGRPTPAV
jgi:hypothetical protein